MKTPRFGQGSRRRCAGFPLHSASIPECPGKSPGGSDAALPRGPRRCAAPALPVRSRIRRPPLPYRDQRSRASGGTSTDPQRSTERDSPKSIVERPSDEKRLRARRTPRRDGHRGPGPCERADARSPRPPASGATRPGPGAPSSASGKPLRAPSGRIPCRSRTAVRTPGQSDTTREAARKRAASSFSWDLRALSTARFGARSSADPRRAREPGADRLRFGTGRPVRGRMDRPGRR